MTDKLDFSLPAPKVRRSAANAVIIILLLAVLAVGVVNLVGGEFGRNGGGDQVVTTEGLSAKQIEELAGKLESRNMYASAAEVAQSRQGDCSEHAVLTAALCRAVGIPAQVVMGYVYCPQFMDQQDFFGGHAWVQVYIGDRWVGLDATRAPGGYTAGHIAQAAGSGNPEDFFALLSIMGRFRITGIEVGN